MECLLCIFAGTTGCSQSWLKFAVRRSPPTWSSSTPALPRPRHPRCLYLPSRKHKPPIYFLYPQHCFVQSGTQPLPSASLPRTTKEFESRRTGLRHQRHIWAVGKNATRVFAGSFFFLKDHGGFFPPCMVEKKGGTSPQMEEKRKNHSWFFFSFRPHLCLRAYVCMINLKKNAWACCREEVTDQTSAVSKMRCLPCFQCNDFAVKTLSVARGGPDEASVGVIF